MSHMVIYRSPDGKPGFQQTEDLPSAVEFVERLRNAEGVENARIYRLEQVNFRFEPYFQVHIDGTEAPAPPPRRPVTASAGASGLSAGGEAPAPSMPLGARQPAEEQGYESTAEESSDANGIRRGLFGR